MMSYEERIPLGRYRHYKGGEYTVLALARHSETEEWLVIYKSEEKGTLWARPAHMWLENVNGTKRFTKIQEP